MNIKKLCIDIAKSESSNEVIEILKKNELWDNIDDNWRIIGGIEKFNTQSIVGNQQSNAVNALVEKLVNCGDSALILNCKKKKIKPSGKEAPNSTREAIEKFFNIDQGKWINSKGIRTEEIAEIYCNLIASGEKGTGSRPNYTIVDCAEGQNPDDFPETFLTLSQGIKNNIKFVQGKFGMGSTGVLQFCRNGIQLILSKKHPELVNGQSPSNWGFTITRQVEPTDEIKSSRWMYLVINNQVPRFESNHLDLLPKESFSSDNSKLKYGSFIKLYNYEIGRFRTVATLDLYNELNKRLVNPVVPVKVHETREFKGHTPWSYLYGLETRLEDSRSNIIEDGFPADINFVVDDQKFGGQLYVYKRNHEKSFGKAEEPGRIDTSKYGYGVMFTYNGQNIGDLPLQFFSTKGLKYDNMKNHILLIIDCSKISNKYAEMFMKSDRERINKNEFTNKIKEEIREFLKNHDGLKQVQYKHRKEEASEKLEDKSKQISMYQQLLKNQPFLEKILDIGDSITSNVKGYQPEIKFEGKEYPTFFDLVNPHPKNNPKIVEQERKPKVSFKTDVVNDYLSRNKDPGNFSIYRENYDITNNSGISLSGYNGKWQLSLPVQEAQIMKYTLKIEDSVNLANPFVNDFYISLKEKKERKSTPTPPKPPPSSKKSIKIPDVTFFQRDEFDKYDADDCDLLIVQEFQDKKEAEYKVNLDNKYIHSYLLSNPSETDIIKEQLKTSMGILGIVLYGICKKKEDSEEFEGTSSYIKAYTRNLAPVLMPLIRDIANLGS